MAVSSRPQFQFPDRVPVTVTGAVQPDDEVFLPQAANNTGLNQTNFPNMRGLSVEDFNQVDTPMIDRRHYSAPEPIPWDRVLIGDINDKSIMDQYLGPGIQPPVNPAAINGVEAVAPMVPTVTTVNIGLTTITRAGQHFNPGATNNIETRPDANPVPIARNNGLVDKAFIDRYLQAPADGTDFDDLNIGPEPFGVPQRPLNPIQAHPGPQPSFRELAPYAWGVAQGLNPGPNPIPMNQEIAPEPPRRAQNPRMARNGPRIRRTKEEKELMMGKLFLYKDRGALEVEEPCTVCQEEYEEEQTCIRLKCKHIFHNPCVQRWFRRTRSCPMCRAPAITRPIRAKAE